MSRLGIASFALHDTTNKHIFDYETPQAEAHEVKVKNINPYLVDASDIVLKSRQEPLSNALPIAFGSMPNDGGYLLLSSEEKANLIELDPNSIRWIRRLFGSNEFINNKELWCLWLVNISPNELRSMPTIMRRVESVRCHRLKSSRPTTQELARTPSLFGEIRQPNTGYLAIPKTSSEGRSYIPIGFLDSETIASSELFTVSNAKLFHFGILTSAMHMAWVKSICGRLKSDYRYSARIVYNNFPWPQAMTDKQKLTIEKAAQEVLDARAKFSNSSLADLYDPLTMPPELVKAHNKLNAAVDTAYSKKKFSSESERLVFLFEQYQQLAAAQSITT